MYPQDQSNQQPEPVPIDYLYQIAPQQKSAGFDKKTKIFLIIAGILIISTLIFVAMMADKRSQAPSEPIKLVARMQKLETVTKKFEKKLQSTALQDVNSSLIAILTTANQSIKEPVAMSGVDLKKQSKILPTLDPSTEIEEKLSTAYLNSTLDEVYNIEMSYQLEDTVVMMKRLQRTTKSKSMLGFLDKNITDFEMLIKRLNQLSSTGATN